MQAACELVTAEMIGNVLGEYQNRLQKCIDEDGGHIEHTSVQQCSVVCRMFDFSLLNDAWYLWIKA